MAEISEAFEAAQESFDRMVSLIAWLYKQKHRPSDLHHPATWPDVWPMDWPELRDIVFREPLLFDLARHQAATDLLEEPARPLGLFQEMALSEYAARLLRAQRPRPGRGSKPGETGIRFLVKKLMAETVEWNVWGVRQKRADRSGWSSLNPTVYAFSEELADRLNSHPLLSELPKAVPTSEAIRSLL
jgi:hypothetical protein